MACIRALQKIKNSSKIFYHYHIDGMDIKEYLTMYRKFVFMCIGLSLLSYLLIGCAIKPVEDIYLNPIMAGQEQATGAKSVTMTDSDVSITATGLDTADLLKVSSDSRINPYVDVTGTVAKPLYTIFNITVKNNRSAKIMIDPALAVLIDSDGNQHEAIPFDTFKLRFPAIDTNDYSAPYNPNYPRDYNFQNYKSDKPSDGLNFMLISDSDEKDKNSGQASRGNDNRGQAGDSNENGGQVRQGNDNRDSGRNEGDSGRTYYYYGNKYDNWNDLGDYYWDWDRNRNVPRAYYRDQSSSYYKKATAQKTLLSPTNLYPEGAKSGFLAFPLLTPEAGTLKLIIPVTLYNGQSKTIHFQFQFQKTPTKP
jgi:hypothetical protein